MHSFAGSRRRATRVPIAQGVPRHHRQPVVHQSPAVRWRPAPGIGRPVVARPVVTDAASDPTSAMWAGESISMAFLVLLERLNPIERAVFLLREVFDYEYREISAAVGRTEVNCRQILRRAKEHVHAARPRFIPVCSEADRPARAVRSGGDQRRSRWSGRAARQRRRASHRRWR